MRQENFIKQNLKASLNNLKEDIRYRYRYCINVIINNYIINKYKTDWNKTIKQKKAYLIAKE